ncbi:hypothetical protein LSH36_314g00003 [Paralvinella palmiformis]|uniref:Fucosyltransferase n=1 Tax=Paralvinella palmiformis TaxID=53620 RepID=A0AAD9JHN0_9ANNE|nr:hypothetical protein LSH36_314g00003 [Paralvinella palmiformis]
MSGICITFLLYVGWQTVRKDRIWENLYPGEWIVVSRNETPSADVTVAATGRHMKTIMLWNDYFGEPTMGFHGLGTVIFNRTRCPHTCYLTNNRSEFSEADAVIIHVFSVAPMQENLTIPRRANPRQIFVFFILESPTRSYKGLFQQELRFSDTFNLTATFLQSPMTDVYMPLGGIERRTIVDENAVPSLSLLKNKSKTVAWFVSNCWAPSARMEYARRLSHYVDVGVFGNCGNLTCAKGNKTCIEQVSGTYMFYLAFENSFCRDYATEKVFRTLQLTMVPIVYGYANYTAVLPPRSYIDVRDYDSPEKLAEYLQRLKRNVTEYEQYFAWKKHFRILFRRHYTDNGICRLCSILHDNRYRYKTNFNPVKDYWDPKKLCFEGLEEKRVVHLNEE